MSIYLTKTNTGIFIYLIKYVILQSLHISCNSSIVDYRTRNKPAYSQLVSVQSICDNKTCKNTSIEFAWIFPFIKTVYICASGRALLPWESRLSAEMFPATDDAVEYVSGAGG